MVLSTWLLSACTIASLASGALGDIYMHNPRGSNNKLNEQSNNRNNANRLFDSQNNGNGGYQAGDDCTTPCQDNNQNYDANAAGALQGVMQFYEGSELQVEWTNQHGCGANPRLHCNLVLQYMCEDSAPGLRDGLTTNTIVENPNDPQFMRYGQHETYSYYQNCKTRKRNKKLFIADRNLNGDTAIYTRQNNNGQRFGFECPEERDYYPYWHPSPWRDVYVCTDEPTRCGYYRQESQNAIDKGNCTDPQYNNKVECETNGNVWQYVGKWDTDPPECGVCPTTRNNHLGQSANNESPKYTWTIPQDRHPDGTKCVLRLRYNISTYDYDGWATDSLFNGANSKVKGNPTSDFVGLGFNVSGPLTLNVNTAQFGRTFEDRSHVFIIRKIPNGLKSSFVRAPRIINLNVRGRRGNIVEVYPSVEYDFVPNTINANKGDYLHIQWTGSDANQRGNSGNGRDGTDRNNLVVMGSQGVNYPMNFKPDGVDPPTHFTNDQSKIAYLAFLNQTNCIQTNDANSVQNCARINAASGYINAGLVRIDNTGVFNLVSTRNSAFSNREQKAVLVASQDYKTIGAAVGISVAATAAAGAVGFASLFLVRYGHANPRSKVGGIVTKLGIKPPQKRPAVALETDEVKRSWLTAKIVEWWLWEGQRATIVFIYVLVNIGVWIYGYAMALGNDPAPYYPYAKGFGKTLNLNCSFIILPVLRNILCWLRSTPLADIIPLDDNINMHKLVFGFISVAAILHATFHYLDFAWNANKFGVDIGHQAWGNLAGATGHLIALMMILMAATSLFKRKLITFMGRRFDGYRTFLMVHKLWMPCFALLWLHGPIFWAFSIWPLALMGLEKLVQTTRAKVDVVIVDAKIVGSDILSLKMKLQGKRKFIYKAGEYLFLNCPDIAELEWHPFTITSAPEEPFFSCHIRARPEMDWCYQLRVLLGLGKTGVQNVQPSIRKTSNIEAGDIELPSAVAGFNEPKAVGRPRLRVDGPYGAASEEVFDHSTVILVGAGIGVTPFISILKSMSIRAKQRQGLEGETDHTKLKVYFYWICRDDQELLSFKDLLDAVIDTADLRDVVSVNTYTTGELNLKKVKIESYNQYSGKPNWTRILREVAQGHQGEEIGVFMCGPLPLARELSFACKRQNQSLAKAKLGDSDQKTLFRFHKENF
ncbi:uncharacterized protein SPPG_05133 [Spizellomyces punctatus DAOM BR117]|uniref:FAD-binding FR-type domain-containing protein n=1 Tax=Spizellomyces punctatus (strain DAOM BR117) TaxID=645134 RepID=A0A0L0HE74_SPIPD|nr:uncharacterized protein SPPG_05133 [Spizellomyces punctatus DAOM BR117]KNC99755.1 hypothetical protein SPPG_05133 [Spizellomyces punctatus DAOM BR117]|eukprot:XP_016607795.1 hypothetical protein SPPG_05133 [Spizellomyces punctatus DAOM BR117]